MATKKVQEPSLEEEAKTLKLAKKTGKRGPRPLDPVEDFDSPTRKGMEVVSEKVGSEIQESFLDDGDAPPQAEVQNGMVLMKFVRCKLSKEKSGKHFVNLELSTALNNDSAPLFGREIAERYEMLRDDAGVTELRISDMEIHTIDVAIASDMKPAIHCAVLPERVSLAAVQEKGSGEETTVIRLSFIAPIPQSEDTLSWGGNNHGNLVWISMGERQGKLLKA